MKLLLALFLVAIFGYFESQAISIANTREELANFIRKYQHLAEGNDEFTQKLEQAKLVSRMPDNHHAQIMVALGDFKNYDAQRQSYDDKISQRIIEIDSQLPDRKLRRRCRAKLTSQKQILKKAYKYSNAEKARLVWKNIANCAKKLPGEDYYDDY